MLKFHKIIRGSHAVACPIFFVLFYKRGWQGGVLKLIKSDSFLVLSAVWVFFPKILDRLRGDSC